MQESDEQEKVGKSGVSFDRNLDIIVITWAVGK